MQKPKRVCRQPLVESRMCSPHHPHFPAGHVLPESAQSCIMQHRSEMRVAFGGRMGGGRRRKAEKTWRSAKLCAHGWSAWGIVVGGMGGGWRFGEAVVEDATDNRRRNGSTTKGTANKCTNVSAALLLSPGCRERNALWSFWRSATALELFAHPLLFLVASPLLLFPGHARRPVFKTAHVC